jgi:hypothetical protein
MRTLLPLVFLLLILGCSASDNADVSQHQAEIQAEADSQALPKKLTWEQSRSRAADFKSKADICFHFENWDKIRVYGEPVTTGKLTTVKSKEVKGFDEFLESFTGSKQLAVVEVSHRFHDHYSGEDANRELEKLKQKITAHGFAKVVLLVETSVGFGMLEE